MFWVLDRQNFWKTCFCSKYSFVLFGKNLPTAAFILIKHLYTIFPTPELSGPYPNGVVSVLYLLMQAPPSSKPDAAIFQSPMLQVDLFNPVLIYCSKFFTHLPFFICKLFLSGEKTFQYSHAMVLTRGTGNEWTRCERRHLMEMKK